MFEKRKNDVYSGEVTRKSIKNLTAAMVAENKGLEWIVTITIDGQRKEEISYKGVYAGEKDGKLESFRDQNGFAPFTRYRSSSRLSSETVVSVLNAMLQQFPLEVVGRVKIMGVPQ